MVSLQRTKLPSILFLSFIQYTYCINFCGVKSFDSIFNVGHLIYFHRCGQMWTYDPRLEGGEGGLIHDYSLLIMVRQHMAADVALITGSNSPNIITKNLNISGFAFQELSCAHHAEDARGKCANSLNDWQHSTLIIADKWMYAFHYDTVFKSRGVPPLGIKALESLDGDKRNDFFPPLTQVAPEFPHFKNVDSKIKFALFDSVLYILYLAIKYEEYYCITYLNMEKMLFDVMEWPSRKTEKLEKAWIHANCFIGVMHGMFFFRNQSYIIGQVLNENRVYDDQVYKMLANGQSRVEFQLMNAEVANNSYEPQTVRKLFGCSTSKPSNISRKKRSLDEPLKVKRQQIKYIAKRVANNVFIQIMVCLLFLVLVYKLTIIPNKVYNKLF